MPIAPVTGSTRPNGKSHKTTRSLIKKPTSQWWVGPEQLKFVPPYLRDVPESPTPTQCHITGTFPSWVEGSFIRYEKEF